ncbi:MAG: DUF2203 domain-containing protein [Candidatus Zixiibacteriota bacterium]
MSQFKKHFTVEEATSLIPRVLAVFERINSVREKINERRDDLEKFHESAPGNGGGNKSAEFVARSEEIGRLLADLEDEGIIVKDVDSGLIDFPHIRDDREVFLCWRIGEKSIAYWHEIEAGYRGRQRL